VESPEPAGPMRRIGVLAVQGDFEAHERALTKLDCEPIEVKSPPQIASLDGLIIPGGESTTISKGLRAYGMEKPVRDFVRSGRPVLGTCAGLIILDRNDLGLMDIEARRNAFGRQVKSFEADLSVAGLEGGPLRAVFIRAPWIESWGPGVEPLAEIDDHLVVARQRNLLVAAFHPELTDDLRFHAFFLTLGDVERRRRRVGADGPRRKLVVAGIMRQQARS